MDFGFWITPEGLVIDVHSAPPYTHFGKAIEMGADNADPIGDLLRKGWIRVSLDTIEVHGMNARKRRAIRHFVRDYPDYYKDDLTVFVEDTRSGKTKSTRWEGLA